MTSQIPVDDEAERNVKHGEKISVPGLVVEGWVSKVDEYWT
jgi:hypothetical protein